MRVDWSRIVALIGMLTVLVLLLSACESEPAQPVDEPATTTVTTTVLVHFTLDEEPVSVAREVGETDAPLRAALEEQLQGPTRAEREVGLFSFFSTDTAGMLADVHLDEAGLVTVDFADFSRTIPNASASAGSAILIGELNATVFQFPAPRAVTYRFEGDCEAFWEWLQVGDCPVIERPIPNR